MQLAKMPSLFVAVFIVVSFATINVASSTDSDKNIEQGNDRFGIAREKRAQQDKSTKKIPTPRTCLDHLKNGEDGLGTRHFVISTPTGNQTVYCDMTSESGSAWTLVMSHLIYYSHEANLAPFKKPLNMDFPVNEKTPSFYMYRMTHAQMSHLKNQSTHWRVTCREGGVDYLDYLRVKVADFDPLSFVGDGVCKKVELINVRGHVGIEVTAAFSQVPNQKILHHESSLNKCEFGSSPGFVPDEDNFGFYETTSHKFRCSRFTGTTNLWFGGYL